MSVTEAYGRATVTVTIQVCSRGNWGANATIAEVMEIGGRETIAAIEAMIMAARKDGLDIKRVGEVSIGAYTWETKK